MSLSATAPGGRLKGIAFLALKIVFALAFIAAACAKLFGVAQMVAEFDMVGLGQWFRYVTGLIEIVGAILLLLPRSTGLGALLLTAVCIGAFFAQLFAIHMDVIHTIVMGAILAAIAWVQRDTIASPV